MALLALSLLLEIVWVYRTRRAATFGAGAMLAALALAAAGHASDFGAPYANLLALSTLAGRLQAAGQPYDEVRLDDEALQPIAHGLARASQDDPRNVEVLNNLAVLFRVLRDEQRAGLASRLAAAAAASAPAAEPSR